MLLIIDNKSRFIKSLEKDLKKNKVNFKVIKAGQRIDILKIKSIAGIILSGGSLGIYDKSISNDFIALMNYNVPMLGFCMGSEVIAVAYGGAIKRLNKKQEKLQKVIIDNPKDPIFLGLNKNIFLKEKHVNYVKRLPKNFKIIAHSDICPIEVMRHRRKKIYGFQSHPEVSGEDGKRIIHNFLKMCGIKCGSIKKVK
ncbi:gamma-glutamyl-gamma-aminobutyrate hydrolase family protein [Candidatus Woesearchaeota archaeon]|nr:gamma-glutamyl-gamma-aminobutyrate hydrolase family protein [Candidatus Woesearchaeota archaeon]MBW3005670.1 gamma-glutamyl-gamma-aminobutyrate hydrolase family protein [Candidatus Woesearchaeota archaeon]